MTSSGEDASLFLLLLFLFSLFLSSNMIVFYNVPQQFQAHDFQHILTGFGFPNAQIIADPLRVYVVLSSRSDMEDAYGML